MHHKATDAHVAQRQKNAKQRQKHATLINFDKGDYLLCPKPTLGHNSKLPATWEGPYLVIGCPSPLVYTIEHLLNHSSKEAHATRLQYNSGPDLHLTAPLIDSIESQNAFTFEPHSILDH